MPSVGHGKKGKAVKAGHEDAVYVTSYTNVYIYSVHTNRVSAWNTHCNTWCLAGAVHPPDPALLPSGSTSVPAHSSEDTNKHFLMVAVISAGIVFSFHFTILLFHHIVLGVQTSLTTGTPLPYR